MNRLLALLVGSLLVSPVAVAQDKKDEGGAPAAGSTEAKIPFFGNESCPYMKGKHAKQSNFVETAQGRVYVCCKDCLADAKKDGEKAAAKAYPSVTKIDNKICPVSGAAIGPKAVAMTWQGYEFKVGAKEGVEAFKKNADLYLALLTTAGVKDVANKSCPVSDKPADGGCVIVGDELVRVHSRKDAEDFKKDVAKYLAKAKAGAKIPGADKGKEKPKNG